MKRIALASTAFALAFAALTAGCRDGERTSYETPDNQIQPLPSPDSSFVLTVPLEEDSDGHIFWRVTITDTSGAVVYVDSESEFVGSLNVYWIWDDEGRAWLYNSDDGLVHFYSDESGAWAHTVYGPAGHTPAPGLPEPPAGLFPGYVDEQEQ